MSQGLVVSQIVDGHDFQVGTALEDGAEEVTADTTKAVDTYTYSHVFLLEVLLCSSCFVSKPTHLLAPIHNRH